MAAVTAPLHLDVTEDHRETLVITKADTLGSNTRVIEPYQVLKVLGEGLFYQKKTAWLENALC